MPHHGCVGCLELAGFSRWTESAGRTELQYAALALWRVVFSVCGRNAPLTGLYRCPMYRCNTTVR